MAEISGKYVYDDSLRPGRSSDGGLSQLLFDNHGKLADHAVFIPDGAQGEGGYGVDPAVPLPAQDDNSDDLDAVLGTIEATLAVVTGALLAAPHVKRWWQNSGAPWLRKLFKKHARQRTVAEPPALMSAPADFFRALELAAESQRDTMSSVEAEKRLIAVLAAAAFIAEQIRTLRETRIEDDDLTELNRAMEMLTTERATDSINRMLERDASLLDDAAAAEFVRVFGGGRVGHQFVPIAPERIVAALSLVPADEYEDGDDYRAFPLNSSSRT